MSEEGLKQALDSIQHDTFLHSVYEDDLSLESIKNAKKSITDTFLKQEAEIKRLKFILDTYQ